jgi:hypothetical protein
VNNYHLQNKKQYKLDFGGFVKVAEAIDLAVV